MRIISFAFLIVMPSMVLAQVASSDSPRANTMVSSDTPRCSDLSLALTLDRVSTMNRMAVANGDVATNYFAQPENKDCLYSIKWMIPVQKLGNGYLLDVNPDFLTPAERGIHQFAFLYTNETFKSRQSFADYSSQVVYAGVYKYTSLSGFDQEIYAFRLPISRKEHSSPKAINKHSAKGK